MKILATTKLPTEFGEFELSVFQFGEDAAQHVLLTCGDVAGEVLTRIHSKCTTGETFLSLKCDCREQLQRSMQLIQEHGSGVIIYLDQEGRGVGLVDKIKAYHLQDEEGLDTVEANLALGLPSDARSYDAAIEVLKYLKIEKVALLTNNPEKITALQQAGFAEVRRVPLEIPANHVNKKYLLTKKHKMGHLLELS